MNFDDIETVCTKSKELIAVLDGLEPEVAVKVFSLVLAGRPNEEIKAIMDATKESYQRITGKEIWDKVPKIKIQVSRA